VLLLVLALAGRAAAGDLRTAGLPLRAGGFNRFNQHFVPKLTRVAADEPLSKEMVKMLCCSKLDPAGSGCRGAEGCGFCGSPMPGSPQAMSCRSNECVERAFATEALAALDGGRFRLRGGSSLRGGLPARGLSLSCGV